MLKPIHLNGGWCAATSSSSSSNALFRTVESYVNPNAYCPVCGEKVFYYQSRYGGRVFFDDLGWPWPKHPCTDNGSQTLKSPPVVRGPIVIKDRSGKTLDIYDLDDLHDAADQYIFTFQNHRTRARLDLALTKKAMKKGGLSIEDFWDTPSFLLRKDDERPNAFRVEFISCRQGKVVRIRMRRSR